MWRYKIMILLRCSGFRVHQTAVQLHMYETVFKGKSVYIRNHKPQNDGRSSKGEDRPGIVWKNILVIFFFLISLISQGIW